MSYISAFDLDHTLVYTNSSLLFYRFLISRGVYLPISILRTLYYSLQHHFFNLPLEALHRKVFNRFLKGISFQTVQEEVALFLKKDFYRFLYYPTFTRLRRAQHEGHFTVILSNAPSFLVGPIADYLEVNAWYSSHYSVDSNGKFANIESVLLGKDKASCVESLTQTFNTSLEYVTAYSDSDLDLPFLEIAGTPIAVNPNSRLLKISRKKSWEIL